MKRSIVVTMMAAFLAVAIASCGSSGSKSNAVTATSTTSAVGSKDTPTTTRTGGPAATTSTLPDPCVLVPKADAVQLADTPLDEGVKAGTPDNLSCWYVGPPTGPTAQLEFYVGDGAKKFLDIDRELGHDIAVLPGVGDEAYIEDFTLFFRTGRRWNVLRLIRLDDFDAYRQPMIDLAKKVAAKG
jgi:hypothetical protein